MIKDRIVRVKLRRGTQQRPLNYIGKVTAFNDLWVVMEARAVLVCRSQPNGVQVDKRPSAIMVPRESIESIRVLPDNFKVDEIRVTTEGQQLRVMVDGAPDCYIGEMGEG